MRKTISTNTPSEQRVGYSRAVVINNRMYITGTTAVDETGTTKGETLGEQTEYIFQKITGVLKKGDFSLKDVVMVRVYVVDMKQLDQFDTMFKKHFGTVNPCCTLVGVSSLLKEDVLVEIELVAEKEL